LIGSIGDSACCASRGDGCAAAIAPVQLDERGEVRSWPGVTLLEIAGVPTGRARQR
jgi:hypothetical protein